MSLFLVNKKMLISRIFFWKRWHGYMNNSLCVRVSIHVRMAKLFPPTLISQSLVLLLLRQMVFEVLPSSLLFLLQQINHSKLQSEVFALKANIATLLSQQKDIQGCISLKSIEFGDNMFESLPQTRT